MTSRFLGLMIVVLLGVAITIGAFAQTLRINTRLTVDGAVITLGDMFGIAGEVGEVIVAQSPAPGKRRAIGVSRIAVVARANGLEWTPPLGVDRIIVRRASRRLSKIEIAALILDELTATMTGDNLRVELANRAPELHIAVGASTVITIENIAFDPRSGRFVASLVAAPNTADAVRVDVSGRGIEVVEIPVLIRRLRRGDVIAANDIEWIEWPLNRLPMGALVDEADLVGLALRRSLKPGQPVRERDVQEPIVVAKGSNVRLVYRTDQMVLSASGKALDDGAMGATIRVLNSQSRVVVEAIVEGGSIVSVSLTPRLITY